MSMVEVHRETRPSSSRALTRYLVAIVYAGLVFLRRGSDPTLEKIER